MTREPLRVSVRCSSLSVLIGLIPHYVLFYASGTPVLTEQIAEWIMARTPSRYAVSILDLLGPWAKPFALTGALAVLGFSMFVARWGGRRIRRPFQPEATVILAASLVALLMHAVGYSSIAGALSFAVPAILVLISTGVEVPEVPGDVAPAGFPSVRPRRQFIVGASGYGLSLLGTAGVAGVAFESYLRNAALAKRAVEPAPLFPFQPPLARRTFGWGLARSSITPVPEFYGMSKNAVDPVINPNTWRLQIFADAKLLREFTYPELLSLPRQLRYQTLRCISNTLKSDLMGTAEWSGIHLSQLVDRCILAPEVIEAAFIGSDGHDDSVSIDYAFGSELLFALGMNGKTLGRTHGFPIRVLAPRYYGCRNVKWLSSIRFVTKPYSGTWQRLGYTKEPIIHIASHIDRMARVNRNLRVGGVSFAGDRSIRAVRVRTNRDPWIPACLEPALSAYTWTRWCAELDAKPGDVLEANAQDAHGCWQELSESNAFPNGVSGPTLVKVIV
jgi:DMSO/TMAO reductase YedYZ molybdopterin-dependent catalytic subunit